MPVFQVECFNRTTARHLHTYPKGIIESAEQPGKFWCANCRQYTRPVRVVVRLDHTTGQWVPTTWSGQGVYRTVTRP